MFQLLEILRRWLTKPTMGQIPTQQPPEAMAATFEDSLHAELKKGRGAMAHDDVLGGLGDMENFADAYPAKNQISPTPAFPPMRRLGGLA